MIIFDLIAFHIQRALDFLQAQSLYSFTLIFWPYMFLDLPRYLYSNLFVIVNFVLERKQKYEFQRQEIMRNPPLVSVVIAALNEELTILRTIRSMHEQTYPNIEIIVIDDGSQDRTYEQCLPLAMAGKIKLLRNRLRGGKSSAVNYGINISKGEFILVLDSDSGYSRNAVLNMVAPFVDPEVGAVAGNVAVRNPDQSIWTALQTLEYQMSIAVGRRFMSITGILPIISGTCGAFRREVLMKAGGMDVGPGEDLDFTLKARYQDINIVFVPDAVCLTDVPATAKDFVKQRLRWERDIIRLVLRKHISILNPFQRNFKLSNFLSAIDIILYQIILGFITVPYLIYLYMDYRELMVTILIAVYICYFISDFIRGLIAWSFAEDRNTFSKYLLYLPLYVIYMGVIERGIRFVAYLQEFFFESSYRDAYLPGKVGKAAIRY